MQKFQSESLNPYCIKKHFEWKETKNIFDLIVKVMIEVRYNSLNTFFGFMMSFLSTISLQ